jgi:hypothetical protein
MPITFPVSVAICCLRTPIFALHFGHDMVLPLVSQDLIIDEERPVKTFYRC